MAFTILYYLKQVLWEDSPCSWLSSDLLEVIFQPCSTELGGSSTTLEHAPVHISKPCYLYAHVVLETWAPPRYRDSISGVFCPCFMTFLIIFYSCLCFSDLTDISVLGFDWYFWPVPNIGVVFSGKSAMISLDTVLHRPCCALLCT